MRPPTPERPDLTGPTFPSTAVIRTVAPRRGRDRQADPGRRGRRARRRRRPGPDPRTRSPARRATDTDAVEPRSACRPRARRLDARQQRRLPLALLPRRRRGRPVPRVPRARRRCPTTTTAASSSRSTASATAIDENRATNPLFLYVIDPIRQVIDQLVDARASACSQRSAGSASSASAGVIGFARRRLAGRRSWPSPASRASARSGLWDESIDTLGPDAGGGRALAADRHPARHPRRPERPLPARSSRPILDVMQIMPTFAYLAPITLLFRIGGGGRGDRDADLRDAGRDPDHGARRSGACPATTVEAADVARRDAAARSLRKVQLPLARRAIGARRSTRRSCSRSSMVVITVLIGAPGLGGPIIRALSRARTSASAFDAGIAIVILAIVLDRITEQLRARASTPGGRSTRSRDRRRPPDAHRARSRSPAIAVVVGRGGGRRHGRSRARSRSRSRTRSTRSSDWIKTNLFAVTDVIKNVVHAS